MEVRQELENRGHSVYPISSKDGGLFTYFWYTAAQIPMKLPRKGVDVYHALATLEAMWLPRHKSIAMFLDLFTDTNPERVGAGMGYSKWKLLVGRKYFEFGSRLAAHCRFITCISDKTKQDMLECLRMPEDKIRVIRLGIPPLEPVLKKDNRFRIGTLGQLDKRKRIDLLIRQFKASRIDAELVIAGQGMDRPILDSLADGDSRIKFLGLVPNEKLEDFYNSLDLFVFPSGVEGYGLPPVEAMSCRKPVVILSDAIMPEEVSSHCVAVPNLTVLLDSPLELDNVIKAVDYDSNYAFAKTHNWKKCVDEYVKLYEEVASD
jgi:glycosyltransferase involved in cell wall biosynthesis